MTSDPGSFARATIVERKPQIIRQVIADNAYPSEILAALEVLRAEIAIRPMHPLQENAPDVDFWNAELTVFAGKTWLEVPWYFAETFFYRKLLEAVGYFQPGAWQGRNPFQKQKDRQIEGVIQRLAGEWDQFSALDEETLFEALLHSSLWGNRADLSNFTVKVKARGGLDTQDERSLILIDHTDRVRRLLSSGVERVDFICDNVGSEVLFDLTLADFLLRRGWARQIHLQLKGQPFFVSDVMPEDVVHTIARLQSAPGKAMPILGKQLDEYIAAGNLVLEADPFWATCLMFRQMPTPLREQLSQSALVLIKGDVNYRRLLDDRHWPYTTRMEDITGYFPAKFVTLRTLKGEIMVGLPPGQAETLQAEDATWLINGKRGVIQSVGVNG